jgi:hypothetical protein
LLRLVGGKPMRILHGAKSSSGGDKQMTGASYSLSTVQSLLAAI